MTNLNGIKVLFVEDDDFIGGIISSNLNKSGAESIWARDGLEALEKLKTDDFSIVLTDLKMEKLNGVEMIREIRKDPTLINMPILVLTNLSNDDEEVVNARALGVEGFFSKSSTPFELLAGVIACALGIHNDPSNKECKDAVFH